MSKDGLKLKTLTVNYSDTNENNFAIELWKILKDDFKIVVIDNVYSNVDYKIINKKTNNVMYLELKCRDIKYSTCDSFIMGKTKIENIKSKSLMPCILVWKFDELIYFKKYSVDLLKYKTFTIQKSKIIYISKTDCESGIENLTELIKTIN